MYRKQHNGQLSIEEFVLPFGGNLDPENRWVLLSDLIPWEEIEDAYAPHFSATSGAPAKSGRVAFGALYIKQRLGLTDEETVMQIQENAYMQYFPRFQERCHPSHPYTRGLEDMTNASLQRGCQG